jgi:hypothetical protein
MNRILSPYLTTNPLMTAQSRRGGADAAESGGGGMSPGSPRNPANATQNSPSRNQMNRIIDDLTGGSQSAADGRPSASNAPKSPAKTLLEETSELLSTIRIGGGGDTVGGFSASNLNSPLNPKKSVNYFNGNAMGHNSHSPNRGSVFPAAAGRQKSVYYGNGDHNGNQKQQQQENVLQQEMQAEVMQVRLEQFCLDLLHPEIKKMEGRMR